MRSATVGALPLTAVSEAQLLCFNTEKLKKMDTLKTLPSAGKGIIVLKHQRLQFVFKS